MREYHCPSCGAELICDASTAATSCPYCGNPTIVPGQFSGMLKPDYIIPFKMEKKDAVQALKSYYRGKFLLPKNFSDSNHIEEIKASMYRSGCLMPGMGAGDLYGDQERDTQRRRISGHKCTSHFHVQREGRADFERIPTDASSKMPDDYMDSIEPFDYREIREFSTVYMPGYLADKYDVDAGECAPRAELRCENSMERFLQSDVIGYQTVAETGRRHPDSEGGSEVRAASGVGPEYQMERQKLPVYAEWTDRKSGG